MANEAEVAQCSATLKTISHEVREKKKVPGIWWNEPVPLFFIKQCIIKQEIEGFSIVKSPTSKGYNLRYEPEVSSVDVSIYIPASFFFTCHYFCPCTPRITALVAVAVFSPLVFPPNPFLAPQLDWGCKHSGSWVYFRGLYKVIKANKSRHNESNTESL